MILSPDAPRAGIEFELSIPKSAATMRRSACCRCCTFLAPALSPEWRKGYLMPDDDTPVLDALGEITAVSIMRSNLEAREHMIARLAALVAVDAPAVSYLLNAGTASEAGVTLEDVQGVLIAVAPIVGTTRVVSAAGNITKALGFAIAVAEAELEAELEEELEAELDGEG
jgi:hypothetical protein